jgi:hypothetical protein
MTASPRILLTGMFDMQNYGDLLFPLIAGRRLSALGYDTVPVAPTGQPTNLGDAMPSIPIAEMMSGSDEIAGILVGGGYIIHSHSMDFLEDYQTHGTGGWCGAGLWLGATVAAAIRDVPIAWNAPGVPHLIGSRQLPLVHAALRAASYAAVRDRGSVELLGSPEDAALTIVPDTIAEIARLWPMATLGERYRRLLARKNIEPDARLLEIHERNRSMAGLEPERLGRELGDFARAHGLVPMLVAVGRSHDDPGVARRLAPHVGAPLLMLDDPAGLIEITAALAHSAAYLGASLHGYIVSAAYGVPGVLLGRPTYRKFAGFLEHTGRLQDLARSWDEALRIGEARVREPRSERIPASVFAALDAHWRAIDRVFSGPDRHREARSLFLRALLRAGLHSEGPAWALLPFAARATRASAMLAHRRDSTLEGAR